MSIALGIDTGGTYTDAVLVNYESSEILASAKALTTKNDLSIGISQAIHQVTGGRAPEISMVSISTTLATNAIVEGKGAPVCALLIGYGDTLPKGTNLTTELATERYALITGGHLTSGEEKAPLDLYAAGRAIREHAPHVAAFAISGFFGTRNPAHELAVKELVREMTGLPVTCGHELTHRLHALRRATTVSLNASLIPLICDLIAAVEQTMQKEGIQAPLMVVKGDGSLMEASVAKERPVETILSGPAASVVGARDLAGEAEDALVVDMGGTTTDIARVTAGHPRLSTKGASVGRWRTMVEAIDAQTVGLGGDSRIWRDLEGQLRIGPQRVIPLCLLASTHPEIIKVLQRQASEPTDYQPTDGQFLVFQHNPMTNSRERPGFESELLAALAAAPRELAEVHAIIKHPNLYVRYMEQLEREGVFLRAGFTPTDAAHALGLYGDWDTQAAHLGAQIMAKCLGIPPEDLSRQVIARSSERIAEEVIAKLLQEKNGDGDEHALDSLLIASALYPEPNASLQCKLQLGPTLVAVGAPVQTYFPRVAELLNGQLRMPHHSHVANAYGAVVGSIVCRVHASIIPQPEEEFVRVHLSDHMRDFNTLGEATRYATDQCAQAARAQAERSGAQDIRLQVNADQRTAPVMEGWGDGIFLETAITAVAIGRPRLALDHSE